MKQVPNPNLDWTLGMCCAAEHWGPDHDEGTDKTPLNELCPCAEFIWVKEE